MGNSRDFSRGSIDSLRKTASITNDNWTIFNWFQESMLTEELSIRSNINIVNRHHQVIMEKFLAGERQLDQILTTVESIDSAYEKSFKSLCTIVDEYDVKLKSFSDIIKPEHIAVNTKLLKTHFEILNTTYEANKLKSAFGTDDVDEIMEIIENKKELSLIESLALLDLAKLYPDKPIPNSVITNVLNSLSNFMDDKGDALSLFIDTTRNLSISLGQFAQKLVSIAGPIGSNSFVMFSSSFSGYMTATNKFITTADKIGGGAGLALTAVSFGIGMWDDINNKDKSVGQAVVHNGLSTAVGVGSTILVGALFSNPVGWAAVGVATLSATAGIALQQSFEWLYGQNFLGLQDALDNAGEWIDDTVDEIGKGIGDFGNWIGECGSNLLDTINPFNW